MAKETINVISHYGSEKFEDLMIKIIKIKVFSEPIKDTCYNEINHTTAIYSQSQK